MVRPRTARNRAPHASLAPPAQKVPHGPCFAPRRETRNTESTPDGIIRDYALLGLEDVFMDFAGRQPPSDPVHAALRELESGDQLHLAANGNNIRLKNARGVTIAQLSMQSAGLWKDRLNQIHDVRVVGIYTRLRDDITDKDFLKSIRSDSWEIPIVEITWHPDHP